MQIAPITSMQTTSQFAATQRRLSTSPPALAATAALLGLSTDDLTASRHVGVTPRQLARERGVAGEDLLRAIATDVQSVRPAGEPALGEAALATSATALADGATAGESLAHRALLHPERARSAAFVDIASWLGLDPRTLLGSLEDGTSLSEIAARQGTSVARIIANLGGATSMLVDTVA